MILLLIVSRFEYIAMGIIWIFNSENYHFLNHLCAYQEIINTPKLFNLLSPLSSLPWTKVKMEIIYLRYFIPKTKLAGWQYRPIFQEWCLVVVWYCLYFGCSHWYLSGLKGTFDKHKTICLVYKHKNLVKVIILF